MAKKDYLTVTSTPATASAPHIPAPLVVRTDDMFGLTATNIYRENLRAALANQALTRTAELALYSEKCIREAPFGEAAYRTIVNSYAYRAAMTIVKGEV